MLGTVDKESSELRKCKNRLMRSLLIFPAAQELQEWSCLASGVISTEAVRSLVNLPEQRRKVGVKLMVKISRGAHNRNLVATEAFINIIIICIIVSFFIANDVC